MRNVKLLWGCIACLMAAAILLGGLYYRELRQHSLAVDPAPVQSTDKVVAKVGSLEIKNSRLEQELQLKYGADVVNQILDRECIRMEAEESGEKVSRDDVDKELKRMQAGYDSEDEYYRSMKEQLGLSKEEIREDTYYKLLLERVATRDIKVTDQEVQDYIRSHPEEFHQTQQLHIQKIVNKTLEQANRTIELYRSGRDFAKLAKERSIETDTASDGGDLGWVDDNDPFIPNEILKAALYLEVGDISEPIEVENGYAVIRLEDKKTSPQENTEEIKQSVRSMLSLQKAPPLQDVTRSLRAKFGAEILDPELKKESAP